MTTTTTTPHTHAWTFITYQSDCILWQCKARDCGKLETVWEGPRNTSNRGPYKRKEI